MRVLSIFLALMLSSTWVQARIYHYETEDGRKVYVDSISRVPPQYRDQLDIREEEVRPVLSPAASEAKRQEKGLAQLEDHLDALQTQMRRLEMPIKFRHNLVIVPVKLVYSRRSVQINLVMDTGASSTVLYRHALQPLRAAYSPAGHAQVADGRTVSTDLIRLDKVVIGPYEVKKARALVMDNPAGAAGAAGLLGNDFLLRARYEIDFDRKLLIWQPKLYKQLQAQIAEAKALQKQVETQ